MKRRTGLDGDLSLCAPKKVKYLRPFYLQGGKWYRVGQPRKTKIVRSAALDKWFESVDLPQTADYTRK